MEITPAGGVVKEATSMQQSSVEEFEKDIGNMHLKQKSKSFESEESCKMQSESQIENTENGINSYEINEEDDMTTNNECNIGVREKVNEEIKSVEIKTTLKGIISEIESSLPPHLIEDDENVVQQEVDKLSDLARQRLVMTDRQTSTTSLEEQQKECNAEALLSLLTKGDIGSRPHSLPANLAHLWHSLKIASELEQTLPGVGGDRVSECDSIEEASGHKVNIEDGLPSKPIDLEKLFTPASDSGEITPSRNRKVYASSSFYASDHPTMEEQVELARRISHSLSDISNKESKGQSMYVNRKKRSVKWVHEGEGKLPESSLESENLKPPQIFKKESKPPLKLVMNPRGQVQDISMLRRQGYAFDSPMSPEVCLDLVRDLNAPRGKGAELFAKRRKKSEKWIIDENNVKTPETNTTISTPFNKLPPPSYLKNSTHRVENVQKMNQIQERFTLPRLKLIKSPWEAALEGSVESAFQEINSPRGTVMAPTPSTLRKLATPTPPLPAPYAPVKEDIYKPKAPRAWNPQPTCKSFTEEPTIQETTPVTTSSLPLTQSSPNFTSLNNFNTAPRGWQSTMSYYRPVTFNAKPSFTDF